MSKKYVFNAPPNWPSPPEGWTPPAGWEPDPSWGPAPHGWPLWVPASASWVEQHKAATALIGGLVVVFVGAVIGAAASGSGNDNKSGGADKAVSSNSVTSTRTTRHAHTAAAKAVVRKTHHAKHVTAAKTTSAVSTGSANQTSWVMPDLHGRDLQTAQDAIQSLTDDAIWYTDSHDATGQDRGQWFDRDWQVCDQNVAAGTRITADSNIDFGVVRRDVESCP